MKRQEVLARLGFEVPESKKKRVIVHTDIACEADDPFAIVHHLLTPSEDVVGIIAAHWEYHFRTMAPMLEEKMKQLESSCASEEERAAMQMRAESFYAQRLHTTELSYALGKEILEKMDIDDVPLIKGAVDYIGDKVNLPESEGADFIIQEAMKESDKPLYIALQGTLTDLAIAYLKEPAIADRIAAAIWIGGARYPEGIGGDFNMLQDIPAAQVIFDSNINLWQYPSNAYGGMNISLAEIMQKVHCKGAIGKFIAEYMLDFNTKMGELAKESEFPHGELWSIGDNPTISALLENSAGQRYHMEKAPHIADDMHYIQNPEGREIRVYDDIDRRVAMDDLFAKLDLCYGK